MSRRGPMVSEDQGRSTSGALGESGTLGKTLWASTREVLTQWRAPDDAQALLRAEYLQFLDSHADGLWRSCRVGHITASALIVDHTGTATLLTLHPTVGRWLQTGGHLEDDDTDLLAAALREAREESGINDLRLDPTPLQLDRHQLQCRAHDGERTWLDHWDVQFMAVAPEGSTPVISTESVDLQWWPLTDLPTEDRSVVTLASRAQQRLR